MTLHFTPVPTDILCAWQAGGPGANGQVPDRNLSDGDGTPCRHCLRLIPDGAALLTPGNRIIYGSGAVVPLEKIAGRAEVRLADPRVADVHVRSARNNCYQVRIDRD